MPLVRSSAVLLHKIMSLHLPFESPRFLLHEKFILVKTVHPRYKIRDWTYDLLPSRSFGHLAYVWQSMWFPHFENFILVIVPERYYVVLFPIASFFCLFHEDYHLCYACLLQVLLAFCMVSFSFHLPFASFPCLLYVKSPLRLSFASSPCLLHEKFFFLLTFCKFPLPYAWGPSSLLHLPFASPSVFYMGIILFLLAFYKYLFPFASSLVLLHKEFYCQPTFLFQVPLAFCNSSRPFARGILFPSHLPFAWEYSLVYFFLLTFCKYPLSFA